MRDIFVSLRGRHVLSIFTRLTRKWHKISPVCDDSVQIEEELIRLIHFYNFNLWHLEDEARRLDVTDAEIAKNKREIDRYNQLRNDSIENLDIHFDTILRDNNIKAGKGALCNSETPGSIIDRLSILSLKIYHMREESMRTDAEPGNRTLADKRLFVLQQQRRDLATALDQLLSDLSQGIKRHKIYHQFKMYNDPRFNPSLYKKNSS